MLAGRNASAIGLAIVYVVLSSAGLVLLRQSMDGARDVADALFKPRTILGAAFYAASFGVWLLALRRHEVTLLYPIFVGLGFIGVALAASLVLDESLTLPRVLGMGVILAGVVLVTR